MNTPQDEPAFPVKHEDGSGGFQQYSGMTLRDYFAGQALATIDMDDYDYGTIGEPRNPRPLIAIACYEMADAMLAERAKKAP